MLWRYNFKCFCPKGPQGLSGPQGFLGRDGLEGPSGLEGFPGEDGTKGAKVQPMSDKHI